MPAPHYALSEALIVAAALWVGWRLYRDRLWLGALGVAIFGFAAAIGVYRFGTNQIDAFATLHREFSQIGGATAMSLVASQLWLARSSGFSWYAVLGSFATCAFCLLNIELATAIFLGWSVVAIVSAARMPSIELTQRITRAAVVSTFLLNVLLVRQSPLLGPDLSWHLFHVLIAVWIAGLWWLLKKKTVQPD